MSHERRYINNNRIVSDDPFRPDDIIYYQAWIERCKAEQVSNKTDTPQSPEFYGQEWEIAE